MDPLVYVRKHGDTYDVRIDGLSREGAMVVRELFSDVGFNREWAYARVERRSILSALRGNTVMMDLHEEFKRTYRDVAEVSNEAEESEWQT